eukprot:jgi/Tetstr1/428032/TSEL_001816.t1
MSRRQTLSALSPAANNSRRSSLGPARLAKQGGGGGASRRASALPSGAGGGPASSAAPRARRPSLGPSAGRRSSTYGKGAGGPRADPRPLSDKAFQAACARAIVAYLSAHGYDHAVSLKQLLSPTTKDFHNIVLFLFKQVEPSFKPTGKMDEEVPAMFKRLRYPFTVSKTALVAVGSPHSWPALLAATAWLVELLNYSERAVASTGGTSDLDRPAGDREFFEYVSTSYKYFLAGDDEACGAVDEATEAKFRERQAEALSDVERIQQANAELQAQLEALQSEPSPKAAALQRREDFLGDIAKFEKLIDTLAQHKGSLAKKIAEREADLASKRKEVALLGKEAEGIRQQLAAQPVNRDDIIRMSNDRAKLTKILEAVTGQREALDRQVLDLDLRLEGATERLEAAAGQYNKVADALQLIPASAKRAAGVAYEMAVRRDAPSAQDLLSVDLKGVIRPGLQRLGELYLAKRRTASEALLGAREKLGALEEALEERREEHSAAEAAVAAMELRHRAAREGMEASISSTHAQAERIQAEIEALRAAANNSVAESEEAVAAAKEELEATKQSCEEEIRGLNEDLTSALNHLVQHKLHIQEALGRLEAKAKGTWQTLSSMPSPAAM